VEYAIANAYANCKISSAEVELMAHEIVRNSKIRENFSGLFSSLITIKKVDESTSSICSSLCKNRQKMLS
jgi:hypothetical protein